jgi:hypothetical protein
MTENNNANTDGNPDHPFRNGNQDHRVRCEMDLVVVYTTIKWARQDSNLQPDRYERYALAGKTGKI